MGTIGFIGVGSMGEPMALRLLDAGHDLIVCDQNQEAVSRLVAKGAIAASTPAEVANQAETIFLSLPTPPIVEQVTLGADGVAEGSAVKRVIDLSTTGPAMAKILERRLREKDIAWIDSPVSGGIKGAAAGTLAIMVSGDETAFEAAQSLLGTFGTVFYVGEAAGAAQVVKLGNNMMAAAAMVVSSEALAMGVKAGVDPQVMLDIINTSSGRNSATQDKFPDHVLTGTFDYGFSTGLSYKDVRLCVDESEALGVPMMAGAVVREMLAITNSKYGPRSCFTSIARVVEDWSGCEIRRRN